MGFKDDLKESFKHASVSGNPPHNGGTPVTSEGSTTLNSVGNVSPPNIQPLNGTSILRKLLNIVVDLLVVAGLIYIATIYFFPGQSGHDIEIVKSSSVPGSPLIGGLIGGLTGGIPMDQTATIGSGISKIAGVSGTAKWSSFRTDKYKDNSNICCVQAVVDTTSDKGEQQTATFQFLLNRSSKYVELIYYGVNGKPETMLSAVMALQYGIL